MQKRILKRHLPAVIVAGALLVLAVPITVGALSGRASAVAAQNTPTVPAQATGATNNAAQAAANQAAVQTRLADARLRVCQTRQTVIANIMSRISDRGQKQLDLFTGIAGKVEKFYTDKGKVLSNYNALVADVNAKQAAAQLAVNAIKTPAISFSCDGTDPMGVADGFKSMLKIEIESLNTYKTSIKNLIVGVKSVQTQTTATTQTTTSTTKTTGGAQ